VEGASPTSAAEQKLSPMARQFYCALLDALTLADPPGQTTRTAWYAECVRTGLADPISPEDKGRARESKTSKFRKYMAEFKAARLIGVDGETVYDLRKTRTASP
jgi:hypothetical protein